MKTSRRKFIRAAAAMLALGALPSAARAASAVPWKMQIGIQG